MPPPTLGGARQPEPGTCAQGHVISMVPPRALRIPPATELTPYRGTNQTSGADSDGSAPRPPLQNALLTTTDRVMERSLLRQLSQRVEPLGRRTR